MNVNHLLAIIRLRWRITRNQLRKLGLTNTILTTILLGLALLLAMGSFLLALTVGRAWLIRLDAGETMLLWDGVVGGFLFFWMTGLMTELQQSQALSLKNFLHLPVSLSGGYLLNYVSSWVSLALLLFLPPMLGLCLASFFNRGATMLIAFPLLLSFLLMVTALTYQIRGWLGRLMENKRTRGTVIAVVTFLFVAVFNIPNLLFNVLDVGKGDRAARQTLREDLNRQNEKLRKERLAKTISGEEFDTKTAEAQEEFEAARQALSAAEDKEFNRIAGYANIAIPFGWLPYGVSAARSGNVLPGVLGSAAMFLIGAVSLWTSFHSTIRSYTGYGTKDYRPTKKSKRKAGTTGSMLEKSVPFLSEHQSTVAMATLRSVLRAPESKMALMTPIIFAFVFGSMLLSNNFARVPYIVRPLVGLGTVATALFGMAQFLVNIFAYDRAAFRSFVLMPVRRFDVLLGKNAGMLPFLLLTGSMLVVVGQFATGLIWSHFLATLLQMLVAFPLYYLIGNFISIAAPVGMSAGSSKPVRPSFRVILIQVLGFLCAPIVLLPGFLAYIAELLVSWAGIKGVPTYLILSALQIPISIWFYRTMLVKQAEHFREREQEILLAVSRVED